MNLLCYFLIGVLLLWVRESLQTGAHLRRRTVFVVCSGDYSLQWKRINTFCEDTALGTQNWKDCIKRWCKFVFSHKWVHMYYISQFDSPGLYPCCLRKENLEQTNGWRGEVIHTRRHTYMWGNKNFSWW